MDINSLKILKTHLTGEMYGQVGCAGVLIDIRSGKAPGGISNLYLAIEFNIYWLALTTVPEQQPMQPESLIAKCLSHQ